MKRFVALGVLAFSAVNEPVWPQGLNVDQSWLGGGKLRTSAGLYPLDPIGQEFTPSFNALNAVEFVSGNARLDLGRAIRDARRQEVSQDAIVKELGLTREQVRRFQREYETHDVPSDS